MKATLLGLMLLGGGSLFAAPQFSVGIGIGEPGYAAPAAAVVAYRPPCPGPGYRWIDGYYGPSGAWVAGYWAAPGYYGSGYYAPRYYGGYWRGQDWDHDGWRDRHEWREHEWREHERHEWREHEEHEHGWR